MKKSHIKYMVIAVLTAFSIQHVFAETKLTEVKVRHNKKYDFSQLTKNYRWVKRNDSSRDQIAADDPAINEYVLSLVNKKLAEKGFNEVYDDSASFGVDYRVVIKEEGTDSSHVRRGSLSQRGSSNLRRYSYVNVEGMPSLKDWRKGTFLLNIVNLETGYVIWVGYADVIVVDKKGREELVYQAVSEMFRKFPPK